MVSSRVFCDIGPRRGRRASAFKSTRGKYMNRAFAVTGILTVFMVVILSAQLGCGGTSSGSTKGDPSAPVTPPPTAPPPEAAVTAVSPNATSVEVGFSVQFTATVKNDSDNEGVTWSVMPSPDVNCSGAGCGRIDATGKYTAPPKSFNPGVFIVATSVSNPLSSKSALVFVTPAPTGIGVSPSAATVPANGTQQFSVEADPALSIPMVSWTLSGDDCSAMQCGTIDSTGKYTAPAIAPNPPTVMVTATSQANSTVAGSATILLGADVSNSKLNGHYAFLLNGFDGDGDLGLAGSLMADGNGNVVSGLLDYNAILGQATNAPITGSYAVTADNRAALTITVQGFSLTFSAALESFVNGVATAGRMIELDGNVGTGILAKQDPTVFSNTAINGDYAFGFSGRQSPGAWPSAAIGRFTASGGNFNAGQLDLNTVNFTDGGTPTPRVLFNQPFTAIYDVSSTGRGSAIFTFSDQDLGFSKFVFYVISANELLFMEDDPCAPAGCAPPGEIGGVALRQVGGPFSVASLQGSSVSSFTGDAYQNARVSVGLETFDGKGGITGTKDENNGGVITSSAAFNGTYTVDNDGEGHGAVTVSGDTNPKTFYLVANGTAFVIDTNPATFGMFEAQNGGPFGNASLSGNYVVGTLPWPHNWDFSPVSGVATADGKGNLTTVTDGTSATDLTSTGTYSVDAAGRAALHVTPDNRSPLNLVFYLISPSKAVGISTDPGTNVAVRVLEK